MLLRLLRLLNSWSLKKLLLQKVLKMTQLMKKWPLSLKGQGKNGSFQKDSFRNKFKKILMATWDELDNEEDSKKDEEQTNLALMDLTSFEVEYNSDSGSESEEENEICFKGKLSRRE
ncbi:hypothetical protein KIW84_053776 [Lathyrus oleraceus]|uniref:Uncharacterized protein n=1 Tax=Pisum sativum TaxID=3888 RepID=A0A9D4WVV9_PEA|nr:hypothetical protein KIW84_053776 [Pisum sativum]